MLSAWPLPFSSSWRFTGKATTKPTARLIGIVIQNNGLARPAFMAPGIISITALSANSIVAIDSVSAATTTPSAVLNATPAFKSVRIDKKNPKKNARIVEITTVGALLHPNAVPSIIPITSPIAQPAIQCNVALKAIRLIFALWRPSSIHIIIAQSTILTFDAYALYLYDKTNT